MQAQELTSRMCDDERGFLKSLLSSPQEDMPRLVYADWLDENARDVPCDQCVDGDVGCSACEGAGVYYDPPYSLNRLACPHCDEGMLPDKCQKCHGSDTVSDGRRERAEFIRVQCELAALTSCCPVCNPETGHRRDCQLGDRGVALRQRERELLGNDFWQYVAKGVSYACSRGFVSHVACPADMWLRVADALFWHPEQTAPCPRCQGRGGYACADTFNEVLDSPLHCCGTGRVPREMPDTAQPLTVVHLTDDELMSRWPTTDVVDRLQEFGAVATIFPQEEVVEFVRWPRLKFKGVPTEYVNREQHMTLHGAVIENLSQRMAADLDRMFMEGPSTITREDGGILG